MTATTIRHHKIRRKRFVSAPQESMADFKQRIAILMRGQPGGEIYSVIGAAHAHESLVRNRPEAQ